MAKTPRLAIDKIIIDPYVLPRDSEDEKVLEEYAMNIRAYGPDFYPPVEVMREGDVYWLWDGLYRVKAHKKVGHKEIPAKITGGTREKAMWAAGGANTKHGVRMKAAEKRRAVMNIVRNATASKNRSDGTIALHVGVSVSQVQRCRTDAETLIAKKEKAKKAKAKKKAASKPAESRDVIRRTVSGKSVDYTIDPKQTGHGKSTGRRPKESSTQATRTGTKDAVGTAIPESLQQVFKDAFRIRKVQTAIDSCLTAFLEICESPAGEYLDRDGIKMTLEDVRTSLGAAIPHVVCPVCISTVRKTCKVCKGHGFLTVSGYADYVKNK